MKEKITAIYRCDFCRKLYLRRVACEKHEKFCAKNPANQHACFMFCKNLVRERIEIEISGDYQDYKIQQTQFQCKASGKFMHSFIAERKGIVGYLEETTERMPLNCLFYADNFEV